VEKLGYEYAADESPDTIQLRTLAIKEAASAKDEGQAYPFLILPVSY